MLHKKERICEEKEKNVIKINFDIKFCIVYKIQKKSEISHPEFLNSQYKNLRNYKQTNKQMRRKTMKSA